MPRTNGRPYAARALEIAALILVSLNLRHTVTAVYVASAAGQPRAADDARAIIVADPADTSLPLAFDHRMILDDYLHWRRTGELAPLRF